MAVLRSMLRGWTRAALVGLVQRQVGRVFGIAWVERRQGFQRAGRRRRLLLKAIPQDDDGDGGQDRVGNQRDEDQADEPAAAVARLADELGNGLVVFAVRVGPVLGGGRGAGRHGAGMIHPRRERGVAGRGRGRRLRAGPGDRRRQRFGRGRGGGVAGAIDRGVVGQGRAPVREAAVPPAGRPTARTGRRPAPTGQRCRRGRSPAAAGRKVFRAGSADRLRRAWGPGRPPMRGPPPPPGSADSGPAGRDARRRPP